MDNFKLGYSAINEKVSLRNKPRQVEFEQLGIFVFESKHSPNFEMEFDRCDFNKFCMVIRGHGLLEAETRDVPIHENQLIFLPANLPHSFTSAKTDPLTMLVICFYDNMFADNSFAATDFESFRRTFPSVAPFNLSHNFIRSEVMNKFRRMIFEQVHNRLGSNSIIWCQLLETLVFLTRTYQETQRLRKEKTYSSAFVNSVKYIDENFDKKIKLEELATMANMSYRRYTELFKSIKNKTVIEYVSNLRIEYAKKLMLETENILDSAFKAGFGDIAYFYLIFKRKTGKTPKQYIQDLKLNCSANEN